MYKKLIKTIHVHTVSVSKDTGDVMRIKTVLSRTFIVGTYVIIKRIKGN